MKPARLIVAGVGVAALTPFFGLWRSAVAVALFYLILVTGVRYMRFIVLAPPDPEVADVAGYNLKYVCTMCGLELQVTKAAKDRPPSHCMEPMVLVREDGKPPLRPV